MSNGGTAPGKVKGNVRLGAAREKLQQDVRRAIGLLMLQQKLMARGASKVKIVAVARKLAALPATAVEQAKARLDGSEIDTSPSPFLPELGPDDKPAWGRRQGVPNWAKRRYRKGAARTVACSMTPDGTIGSMYFEEGGRIRTTHPTGPKRSTRQRELTRQFNVDMEAAEEPFLRAAMDAGQAERVLELSDEAYERALALWVNQVLRGMGTENLPEWITELDGPGDAWDLEDGPPPEKLKLIEIFYDVSGNYETWHPSRGTAVKFETDKQTISVLEAGLRFIDDPANKIRKNDYAARNRAFYEFVIRRLPNFKEYLRHPSTI